MVLSFAQAQSKAVDKWRAEQHRALTGFDPSAGPYTVASAMRDYLAASTAAGKKAVHSMRSIADGYVIPALGDVDCDNLTMSRISTWFNGVATAGRLGRVGPDGKRTVAKLDKSDPEALRRRRATANRVLTVLKAGLNHAYHHGRIANDQAWRRVKPFRAVDRARTRFLAPAEAARLINAADGDLRALIRGALLTGCRYGELTRLKIADINLQAGSVHIRESKSGHPRYVPLNGEGLEFFTRQMLGRTGSALVFTRNGSPWRKSDQIRPMLAVCAAARIEPVISFHGLRDTYASALVMSGAPIEVVAKLLGHSDSRITAKHYAHLAPSYVSDVVRSALPRFASPDELSNVAPIALAG